jgi:SAM-dependent methyltransferase
MHKFSVAIDDFYQTFCQRIPRIDACMQELIARYNIADKSVLSVGAGLAREERQFALAGNDLLLVDVDESDKLLPQLQRMPERPGLSYWIGDAAEFVPNLGTYDVIYFSSFTPDEFRREAMVREQVRQGKRWDLSDDPFHPVMMEYTNALKTGGLFLIQSYCGGIDADANPDYLAACERQLRCQELHLVEVHRFQKTYGIMLYTAFKGKHMRAPTERLSQFHGRASPEPTERIFAAGISSAKNSTVSD